MEPVTKKPVAQVAAGIAAQPVAAKRPEQWGLLTAVSPAAKERKQVSTISSIAMILSLPSIFSELDLLATTLLLNLGVVIGQTL